jgi:hypothetical protein
VALLHTIGDKASVLPRLLLGKTERFERAVVDDAEVDTRELVDAPPRPSSSTGTGGS